MAAVFISYRRADSASAAGRIDDQLVARFGRANVFKDVDSIPPGVDFARYIEDAIRRSHVVLVIIGSRWLSAAAGLLRRRRLDDPADYVRVEIETALRLGVPIIPLLVENASMPPAARLPVSLRPLATLNALPIRPDPDFHRDLERVLPAVERLLAGPPPSPPTPPSPTPPSPTPPLSSEPAPPKSPAIAEALDPLSVHEPLSRPAIADALPATPLLSSQKEQVGGEIAAPKEMTPKRPTRAFAQRMGAKPSRRPAPGTLVATISALILLAVAATLLLYGQQPFALAALFTDTSATKTASSGTATEQARSTYFAALGTAKANERLKEYQRDGIGPCDTTDPDFSYPDNPYYWDWTTDSGEAVQCVAGNIARITGHGSLAFYGLPAGFPTAFTATLTLSFHSSGDGASCFILYFLDGGARIIPNFRLCDNGTWDSNGGLHCCISASGALHILVTVTSQTLDIKVNGRQVLAPTPHGTVTLISMEGRDIAPGAWLGASNFDLIPTAP